MVGGDIYLQMIFADDIVLVSYSLEGVLRHLNASKSFCIDTYLLMNLAKIKMMSFNRLGHWDQNLHIQSYTNLGVVFIGSQFSYESCSCPTFLWICGPWCPEPQTKFGGLISYRVESWGLGLRNAQSWTDSGRPFVSMIAHMIRSKTSVPHDTIQENMGTAPIVSDAIFQSMTGIQWRSHSKILKNCTHIIKTVGWIWRW